MLDIFKPQHDGAELEFVITRYAIKELYCTSLCPEMGFHLFFKFCLKPVAILRPHEGLISLANDFIDNGLSATATNLYKKNVSNCQK